MLTDKYCTGDDEVAIFRVLKGSDIPLISGRLKVEYVHTSSSFNGKDHYRYGDEYFPRTDVYPLDKAGAGGLIYFGFNKDSAFYRIAFLRGIALPSKYPGHYLVHIHTSEDFDKFVEVICMIYRGTQRFQITYSCPTK